MIETEKQKQRDRAEMEMGGEREEEIGMFVARASELRSKFDHFLLHHNSINTRSGGAHQEEKQPQIEEGEEEEEEEEEQVVEEEESLVNIRDAFESLEHQLSSLQALQQQQRYEREASLVQIGHSRMTLLSKLKEYKGNNLEVVEEALTFAGRTLWLDDDLLLPPYPSHLPDLFVLDDLYSSSHITSKYMVNQNGLTGDIMQGAKKDMNGREEQSNQSPDKKIPKGIWFTFRLVSKSVLTIAGVVCVLSMSGLKPMIGKYGIQCKIQELFQRQVEERQLPFKCPPGKFLLVEDGKARCVVKERVEMPFDLDVSAPKISYGLG